MSEESSSTAARFRPTQWSLVLQSRGDGQEARRAMEDLCQAYWFPLYAWCRRNGSPPADAEDFVQGFFVQVIAKQLFAAADASRGKLRTFLLTALERHVKDEVNKSRAERRGGGRVISFDTVEAEEWYACEQVEGESAERLFDRQWALAVLDQALKKLEQRASQGGKTNTFQAMRPFLNDTGTNEDYEKAAKGIGLNLNSFKVGVHRLRGRFRDALRQEVSDTLPEAADVDGEMSYLMTVLGNT